MPITYCSIQNGGEMLSEDDGNKNAARKNPAAFQKLSSNYINNDKIPV